MDKLLKPSLTMGVHSLDIRAERCASEHGVSGFLGCATVQ